MQNLKNCLFILNVRTCKKNGQKGTYRFIEIVLDITKCKQSLRKDLSRIKIIIKFKGNNTMAYKNAESRIINTFYKICNYNLRQVQNKMVGTIV